MAVTISGTPGTAIATGPPDPWTVLTYTPEAGSDRLLIVMVSTGQNINDPVTGVTAGGQAMTQIGTAVYDGAWSGITVWRLLEAGIAAMSGTTFSIAGSGATGIAAIAFTLVGVDQTTPVTSPQSGSGTTGTTAQASAAVTSTANGLVVGGLTTTTTAAANVTPSHTQIAELPNVDGFILGSAQQTAGTGGSINLTWTQSDSEWAVRTFNVQAAEGGGGGPILVASNPVAALLRPFNMSRGRGR